MDYLEDNFKVGDWVILTDKYLNEALSRNKESRFVKDYYLPQKILDIRYQESKHISTLFVFAPNKMTTLERNSFRLATELEITRQKIKNIFIEKKLNEK